MLRFDLTPSGQNAVWIQFSEAALPISLSSLAEVITLSFFVFVEKEVVLSGAVFLNCEATVIMSHKCSVNANKFQQNVTIIEDLPVISVFFVTCIYVISTQYCKNSV